MLALIAYLQPVLYSIQSVFSLARLTFLLVSLSLGLLLSACQQTATPDADDVLAQPWDAIAAEARGTTVHMMMWTGDPYINDYMRGYVTETLAARHGITLNVVSGQGSQIVSMLMTEREAGVAQSELDMVWINGETFYQLRQIDALFGPFTDKLPNSQYIDFDNPFIGIDFQQPVDGYEAPWGNVQFALIYDTTRVANPPRTMAALEAWVQANPGRFTFDTSFAGMTLLKSFLAEVAEDPSVFNGPFDEVVYAQHAEQVWAYLNRIKPYFWRDGETFPTTLAQLHQLFASGEVDFTMSNNDGEVDNKVFQGLFPETARAYVLDAGTIQNSHYLGLVNGASNPAGALVAINFLISPAAQLRKMDPHVWGDGTVLDLGRLPAAYADSFRTLPNRRYAPNRETIQDRALPELAPEYMVRLYDDFRREVIER